MESVVESAMKAQIFLSRRSSFRGVGIIEAARSRI